MSSYGTHAGRLPSCSHRAQSIDGPNSDTAYRTGVAAIIFVGLALGII
jgi:hypothetical protein